MGRSSRLQSIAGLLSRAAVGSGAQRACAGETDLSRRFLTCSTRSQLHACQAPIAAGSPVKQLLQFAPALHQRGVRHISVQALQPTDTFAFRHNSASAEDVAEMVKVTGFSSIEELIDATVPKPIKLDGPMDLGKYTEGFTESDFIAFFKKMASKNKVNKSYIGMGYYNTILPPVIARNLLENPGWYTQYTPYQAEIAQGRLESLLNFQTLVSDLTGMPLSNSSLLDEGTAAAEAMTMCTALARQKKLKFLISDQVHPQTIAVCQSRADGLTLTVEVVNVADMKVDKDVSGVLLQYPASDGSVHDYTDIVKKVQDAKAKVVVSTDLLACTMLQPPGEWGADIVIGSAQRMGVPMGYGGPHAAFLACSVDNKRLMPGRIIGVSKDMNGKQALRMAMQTREQHIRRDKATSNICTAQALLANIAAMYAVYHGPQGLTAIAKRVNGLACILAEGARQLGHKTGEEPFFDTVKIDVGDADKVVQQALKEDMNLRKLDNSTVTIALDETTKIADIDTLFSVLNGGSKPDFSAESLAEKVEAGVGDFKRSSPFLEHEIFNLYQSEHEMLRYLKRLENKDLSLAHSMIALGSCTMKLNATSEMIPISWPELANLHPFAPQDQAQGYQEMFEDFAQQLAVITGFDKVSLQPNSGAAGEYAGLMAIRGFHKSNKEEHRNICIIPTSAHGTNPASAVMAGMKVVTVGVDKNGNIDVGQLQKKCEEHKDKLAALMVTYPSTHGVYEEGIDEMCNIIHEHGGQVYMDGANMNAQVGLTSPGVIGADVCHLNLHKTFCIPHGGGGPGMGPIGVKQHLAPFLPTHPVVPTGAYPGFESDKESCGTLASAPYGSALILPISYAYISMMGSHGLKEASMRAILNANYMAKRLEKSYPVLYKGKAGTCAHEFILDIRSLKDTAGIEPEDIAKRLIDYGFHAPTMSWPVTGTLMVEPTESESKAELDRFCNAMIAIREEIRDIENGKAEKDNNVVSNSPHPADEVLSDKWDKPYSRELAAYPASWTRQAKFWPTTSRVDNVHGDRHLVTRLPESTNAFAVAVGE